MLARRVLALWLAALLLCTIPPAVADNNIQSATPLTDGVTSSGYVCDPDCDAGNDQSDFWKIEAKKGDIVQISFSGTMNGPAWWCIGDGWQGRVSLLDAQGGTIVDSYVDDNAASKTLSTTVGTQGFVYFKVKADDSWCNDGSIIRSHLRLTRRTVTAMKMALLTSMTIATRWWVPLPMTGKAALTPTTMAGRIPKRDGCHKTALTPFSSNRRSGLTATMTITAITLMATRATIALTVEVTLHWTVSDALTPTGTATQMRTQVALMASPLGSHTLLVQVMPSQSMQPNGTILIPMAMVTTGLMKAGTPLASAGALARTCSMLQHRMLAPSLRAVHPVTVMAAQILMAIPTPMVMSTGPSSMVRMLSHSKKRSGVIVILMDGVTTKAKAQTSLTTSPIIPLSGLIPMKMGGAITKLTEPLKLMISLSFPHNIATRMAMVTVTIWMVMRAMCAYSLRLKK
jgi:hypothetical protein